MNPLPRLFSEKLIFNDVLTARTYTERETRHDRLPRDLDQPLTRVKDQLGFGYAVARERIARVEKEPKARYLYDSDARSKIFIKTESRDRTHRFEIQEAHSKASTGELKDLKGKAV